MKDQHFSNRLFLALLCGILMLAACSVQDEETPVEETKYPIAHIETRLGSIYFWMSDSAPNHKAKFIELAKEKHYDQFTFNRVVQNFVIQGGCPDLPEYFENSPYLLDPEFNDSLLHTFGAVGIGRDDNPNKQSNVCQFYIVTNPKGLPNLDGNYMIFGRVIKGMNVVQEIESTATNLKDEPLESIPIKVSIDEYTKAEISSNFNFSF